MDELLIKNICPNCQSPFTPDYTFGNIMRCKACKTWSRIVDGQIREDVFYKIVPFKMNKAQLIEHIISVVIEKCKYSLVTDAGEIEIVRKYVPVREIYSGDSRKLINGSLESFLLNEEQSKCANYDKLIPHESQESFNLKAISDKTVKICNVDINKEEQDMEYSLYRSDAFKIIFLPTYEIHFKKNGEVWECLGLDGFWGLDKFITHKRKYGELLMIPTLYWINNIIGALIILTCGIDCLISAIALNGNILAYLLYFAGYGFLAFILYGIICMGILKSIFKIISELCFKIKLKSLLK